MFQQMQLHKHAPKKYVAPIGQAMKRFLRFFLFLNHRTLYWTIRQALRRRLLGLSAEIAFNVMLSLFPTIIMALTALGLFTATLDKPNHSTVGELLRRCDAGVGMDAPARVRGRN